MKEAVQDIHTLEENVSTEMSNFINEGLIDVQRNNLYDFDEVFNELESRYISARI